MTGLIKKLFELMQQLNQERLVNQVLSFYLNFSSTKKGIKPIELGLDFSFMKLAAKTAGGVTKEVVKRLGWDVYVFALLFSTGAGFWVYRFLCKHYPDEGNPGDKGPGGGGPTPPGTEVNDYFEAFDVDFFAFFIPSILITSFTIILIFLNINKDNKKILEIDSTKVELIQENVETEVIKEDSVKEDAKITSASDQVEKEKEISPSPIDLLEKKDGNI